MERVNSDLPSFRDSVLRLLKAKSEMASKTRGFELVLRRARFGSVGGLGATFKSVSDDGDRIFYIKTMRKATIDNILLMKLGLASFKLSSSKK